MYLLSSQPPSVLLTGARHAFQVDSSIFRFLFDAAFMVCDSSVISTCLDYWHLQVKFTGHVTVIFLSSVIITVASTQEKLNKWPHEWVNDWFSGPLRAGFTPLPSPSLCPVPLYSLATVTQSRQFNKTAERRGPEPEKSVLTLWRPDTSGITTDLNHCRL